MTVTKDPLYRMLVERGVSRRAFLKFSAAMASALALPMSYAPRIAKALERAPRVPVIWLEGQDCAGNTEAFLRASHPTVAEIVLDTLSVDYHETIMTPAGDAAEKSKHETMRDYDGQYLVVIEGSIPIAENGIYCTIGGRTFKDIVEETCAHAAAVISVGSCAFDGGLPAASGGPTGAAGVASIVPKSTVINLPGCPMNVQNLTATIVHFLTFGAWPATDPLGRPLFAYGQLIHDQCERRAHFESGRFVQAWGDEGARKGWCLYKMGCKGPETYANCPTARFNDGASWPVKAGHGCVGCTMPRFWDQMSPFYRRLPTAPAVASDVTADQIGLGLVAAVTGLSAAHGVASYARKKRQKNGNGAGPIPPALGPTSRETGDGAEGIQA
ncbi:MAG TPA: hydrogenase small subunit [Candidatus Sulfomarinibacteraceae bacterium]|nr:hydrogenase small subunit [Candidatus Sulfomarinibacteraceae bacterium]